MDVERSVDLCRDAVYLALMIGGPLLLASMLVSILLSLAQALTSIQDQTISTVPRIIIIVALFLLLLPWILNRMIEYATELIREIPNFQ